MYSNQSTPPFEHQDFCNRDSIPGTDIEQITQWDDNGCLQSISLGGHCYVEKRHGQLLFDHDFVSMRTTMTASGMVRWVKTPYDSWQEQYKTDLKRLPIRVDGMQISRDEGGRVTGCQGHEQDWRYVFTRHPQSKQQLSNVSGPFGERQILRDKSGRPIRYTQAHYSKDIHYDDNHQRQQMPSLPAHYHFDDEGRLRCISTDAISKGSRVKTLFLWDGYNCIARLDGEPGAPLTYVYSLDMTGTPVRIISRTQQIIVPRDAYGENLLPHQGHPGLFGGAQYQGYVWLRSRVMDLQTASFNAPDPLHGGKQDPRRQQGFGGELIVETPKAGPYVVCQYDPITFFDPTGEIAWYYMLSTLTWAFPNNILSWIGLWGTASFWAALFTGNLEDWYKSEDWKSERLDISGVQREPFFVPSGGNTFTTQHIIWSEHDYIQGKRLVTVFNPLGDYSPQLYASMLRIEPTEGAPFLLASQQNIGSATPNAREQWTRAGGNAAPVAPGQKVPVFPEGGLHFHLRDAKFVGQPVERLYGPQAATITELTATGEVGIGTLDNKPTLSVALAGLSLNQGDLLLLTDGASALDIVAVITTVPDGAQQTVHLASSPNFSTTASPTTTGITLQPLQALTSTENLQNTGMPSVNYLDATSTANAYQVNDALRLNDGSNDFGAQISAFETQVTLDDTLNGTPVMPMTIFAISENTTNTYDASISTPTEVDFTSGPTPSVGSFAILTDGTLSLAVLIVNAGAANVRIVDRDISGLSGPAINWHTATRGSDLGSANALPTAQLNYAPAALNVVPAANDHIGIEYGPAGAVVTQLRTVTALNHHALVLNTSAPLPASTSFSVDRHLVGSLTTDLSLSQSLMLGLTQGSVTDAVALQVYQFTTPTPAPGSVMEADMALSGAIASHQMIGGSAGTLTPNQPVMAVSGTNNALLVTARITREIFINFDLNTLNTTLEIVPMAPSGFAFDAEVISATEVRVSPIVSTSGAAVAVDMPVFSEGECVEIINASNIIGQYRITAIPEGTVIALNTGPALPAVTTPVTVRKIAVTASGTGNARIAIKGRTTAHNAAGISRIIKADVWNRDHFPDGAYIGVVIDNLTLPYVVTNNAYDVTVPASNQVDISPSTIAGASVATPIVATNDIIKLNWQDGGAQSQRFKIDNISGTILTMTPIGGAVTAINTSANNVLLVTNNAYDVTVPASNQVDVAPSTIAGIAVATPIIAANDVIQLDWQDGGAQSQRFQIGSISGTVLTMTPMGGTATAINTSASNVLLSRFARLEVEFTTTPSIAGPLDLAEIPANTSEFFASFTRETEQLILIPNVGTLTAPSSDAVMVVPLTNTGSPQTGTLGSGNGKVPEDPENTQHGEHDRHQLLVEHELRHTEQYLWWGPMFLTLIPIWPLELGLDLGTDIEEPDFGPYQEASLRIPPSSGSGAGAMKITFSDGGNGGFALDQEVQFTQGPNNKNCQLKAPADGDNGFRITAVSDFTNGTIYVRSVNSFPDWYHKLHGALFSTFSMGGLTQLAGSLTYGLFPQIVGRFFYMIYRGIQTACCDDRQEGTVQNNGTEVHLSNPADAGSLANIERLLVQEPQDFGNTVSGGVISSGIATVVRNRVGAIINGVVTLSAPLSWEDGSKVDIGPYESRTPGQLLDWKTYYPATVQSDNYSRLQVHTIGDDTLTLEPFDRLRVIAESADFGMFNAMRTVISVTGDIIELDKAAPVSGTPETELTVRISKIGTEDPFDFVDTVGVNEIANAGWFRWASDPFGKLQTKTNPEAGSFLDVLGRSGKYVLGTKAWSNPILLFSRYFSEIILNEIRGKGELYHVSIEQDASEQSGHLYTAIGRVRGEASVNNTSVTMTVGDIARFWYFAEEPFGYAQSSSPALGATETPTYPAFLMNEAGNHLRRDQIILVQQTPEVSGGLINNGATGALLGASPGLALADIFWQKNANDPNDVSINPYAGTAAAGVQFTDRSMIPTDRGLVPQSAELQLSSSVYMAYTRPTATGDSHRATMVDGIDSGPLPQYRKPNQRLYARDAHDEESQRLFFNVTVQDVTVNVNGLAVADGTTVTLLRTQTANITVNGEGTKQYAVRVMQPTTGTRVRASFTPKNTLSAQDPYIDNTVSPPVPIAGPFTEPFQICRWHDLNETTGVYRSGGLAQHNMHLPEDIFIPVRKLTVDVAELPPVLNSLPATLDFSMYTGAALPAIAPGGELFFPVAANILIATHALRYVTPLAPDNTVKPDRVLDDVTSTATQQVQDFLGDGLVYSLTMASTQVPEEQSTIDVIFTVGDPSLAATMTMTMPVDGHFLARDTGALAASGYEIAVGSSEDLSCVELDGATNVTPDSGNVVFTLRNGSAVPQLVVGGAPVNELTFAAAGNVLTVNVNAGANVSLDDGFRRLVVLDVGGSIRAARTVRLV